jgi:exonuclease III
MRLNSLKQISAVHDLEKKLFLKGYKLFHNSSTSLRGVGILVNRNYAESDFLLLNEVSSNDGNILGLHVEINGQKVLFCSIYGPNKDTDITFYDELKNTIRPFNCPVILGGDWNATFDTSDVNHNLDIVNETTKLILLDSLLQEIFHIKMQNGTECGRGRITGSKKMQNGVNLQ